MSDDFQKFLNTLREAVDPTIWPLFESNAAAARLLEQLPQTYPADRIVCDPSAQKAWELAGLFFWNQRRFHEALSIFFALYLHIASAQKAWVHKGMPLVWIAECFEGMGFPVHAKRYLMLTLCEDAIRDKPEVLADNSGIYFRIVWRYGLPEREFLRYANLFSDLAKKSPDMARFPEWLLQQVDQAWMTELPSPAETGNYRVNPLYLGHLLQQLGDRSGRQLELLAEYVLGCMPGCRTTRRTYSQVSEYDIVCAMEGFDVDFRSELGRYFVCECKDWNAPADFTTMAKFCRMLDSTKARFGILFSKLGISGSGQTKYAEREQLKVFQDRGIVIVVIDEDDIRQILRGDHFVEMLRRKYEAVRLDLRVLSQER